MLVPPFQTSVVLATSMESSDLCGCLSLINARFATRTAIEQAEQNGV
jgi:hypothetical protein